ncbi:adenylosuccinate lyase [Lutibacter sp. TH_r2]|uniref:adenylosuccinate lyase n=1 Tax=Lutibacter sp. TH_r2 TaxID=3082083 RepID=UPI002952AA61|nr:adenylosuccinate lyase [Lutibacter sp. TH_r2]MDV7188215.1 adenylosuccinate lyase [Lutibacter sp. TH_r2]
MSKEFLINELENLGTALRINRDRVSNLVLENPNLLPYLIELIFEVNNKLSIKAAWVLELVCEKHIDWLAPYLDLFTSNIGKTYFESAVRPISKICNFLAIAYNSKTTNLIKKKLTNTHIEAIIETGFDWMISQHKVAVKAYTMNTLYLFGKNSDWVHKELKLIIQQNILNESAAYKARGKMTLALINKK